MTQTLPGASPIPTQRKCKIAAALLFASAAIACSLTVFAIPPGQGTAPEGTISRQCDGAAPAQIVSPFADHYSCVSLGSVPGVEPQYGGLTFKYNDPNTLLIGGGANTSLGRIYQIAVTRDANMHITGFSGMARLYPNSASGVGQYNDGSVTFGPDNVLFVTRYPANQLEQTKPGSTIPSKVIDLTPLGVASSVGSVAFVPQGLPGAGKMKLSSFTTGGWYDVSFTPDGNGTFDITSADLRANIASVEGVAFVPPGSPAFPSSSALIAQYSSGQIIAAYLDANGDPLVSGNRVFMQGLNGAEGATIDPVTGDFLFCTFGSGDKIILVQGFELPATPTPTPIPSPTPTATPTPVPGTCQFRVLIAYTDANGGQPTQLRDEIRADSDVAAVDLFDASKETPTLGQLQQYDIVIAFSNGPFFDATTLGDNLAAYVDGGGAVVQSAFSFSGPGSPSGVNGRWATGNYCPYNYSTNIDLSTYTAFLNDPDHPLMSGVTSLNFTYLEITIVAPGASKLASALPSGDPLVVYRTVSGGHKTVGIAARLGTNQHSGDWGRLIVNAGRWLRPCGAPSPTPTATPTATATGTPTGTATPAATATASPIPTATPTGTATPAATPTATPTTNSRLANISTRMRVEAGDNVLIAGFIVEGDGNKGILIRGIGPSLATFGITDPLQDPTLELNASGGSLIASNDNWPENSNAAEIMTSDLAPSNPNESALLLSVAPGSYTAVLRRQKRFDRDRVGRGLRSRRRRHCNGGQYLHPRLRAHR
jgi:hypothetical protein